MFKHRPYTLLLLTFLFVNNTFAQQIAAGVVLDAQSKETLPYATIRIGNTTQGTISDINGAYSLALNNAVNELHISYAGYIGRTIAKPFPDTILLQRKGGSMAEVVIRPDNEKVKRIINTAISRKDDHNPDKYEAYKCNVYYKMNADMLPSDKFSMDDSTTKEFNKFIEHQHVLFGETYSKRSYRRADKLQETILASRLSGFQKTYFTNLVTSLLPFHVYSADIMLNGVNYAHPVAKGWQGRYEFALYDELGRR